MVNKKENKFKKTLNKIWYILWKDNSLTGWFISLAFILILVKFLFFPFLGLITGTSMPLAIVESCSMYHSGGLFSNFDNWWENHENKYEKFSIDKEQFSNFIIKNGLNKGDIIFITRANPNKLKVGDIIIFDSNKKIPIIHRIIEIREENGEKIFSTIGDNNEGQFVFEKEITENRLVGKASFKILPYFGWIKLIFYEWGRTESERGFC